jgi:diguanylate cyclase (GGDEF)-like protein
LNDPIDIVDDPLADARLTAEQRKIWEMVRSELMIARVRIPELENRIKALDYASHEDAQTILTRPEFNREVARMLAFDERYGGVSSVLYIDVDNLADIHKKDGRAVADTIIRVMCDELTRNIRSSDIAGRLATDEFGVLLTRCDNDNAWKKGEDLTTILVEKLGQVPGCTLQPVINFGAYTFKEKENVASGLEHAAESITQKE